MEVVNQRHPDCQYDRMTNNPANATKVQTNVVSFLCLLCLLLLFLLFLLCCLQLSGVNKWSRPATAAAMALCWRPRGAWRREPLHSRTLYRGKISVFLVFLFLFVLFVLFLFLSLTSLSSFSFCQHASVSFLVCLFFHLLFDELSSVRTLSSLLALANGRMN